MTGARARLGSLLFALAAPLAACAAHGPDQQDEPDAFEAHDGEVVPQPGKPVELPHGVFSLEYLGLLVLPVSYEAPAFSYVARTNRAAPTWVGAQKVTRASFAARAVWTAPLDDDRAWRAGVLHALADDNTVQSAFDSSAPRSRVRAATGSRLEGVNGALLRRLAGGEAWALWGGGGLGLYYSRVSFDAALSDAVNAKVYSIASYTSYVYAAAAELSMRAERRLGERFILSAEVQACVPVATVAHGESGYVDFSAGDFGGADYRLAALREGLAHKAAKFAGSLALGGAWQF